MTGPVPTSVRPTARAGVLRVAITSCVVLGLAGLLATSGWLLLFSTFMPYDDEGYILISLRHFAQFGALYDHVYTQYGPFFFLTFDAFHKLLHFDWTSSSGRWVTLGCWLASAGSCAVLVARRTGSVAASAFALAATFAHLIYDIYEPSHPGSFVGVLVAIVALVGSQWDIAERRWAAAAIGALGAALALIKINVGGFVLIAAGAWLIAGASWFRTRRTATVGLGFLLAALPWALTRQMLADASVQVLAINTSLAAISVVIGLRSVPPATTTARTVVAFFVGAGCLSLLTVGLICMRGTSLHALLSGVVLEPMRLQFVNFMPFHWSRGSSACAGAALLLTFFAYRQPHATAVRVVVGLFRLLGAIYLARIALLAPGELALFGMNYGVGIAGLCALPMRFDAAGLSDARARTWLALLLVLQSLQVFPVAGSQICWATFLIVPLLTLAVRDAWLAWVQGRSNLVRRFTQGMAVVVTAAGVGIAYGLLVGGSTQYRSGEPLGLPGAEDLSLPPSYAWTLRTLSENAHVHAGVLFSLHGMSSFNLWSGRPTPTLANVTLWHLLLKPEAQREIIARLREDPRAAVIVQAGADSHGELFAYLQRDFQRAFSLNGLTFLVHRGRRIAPLSTARMSQTAPGEIALDLILARPAQPISRIEVRDIGAPGMPVRSRLAPDTAMLEATPIGEDGLATSPIRPLAWPAVLTDSLTRVRVRSSGQLSVGGNRVAFVFSGERRVAVVPILAEDGT